MGDEEESPRPNKQQEKSKKDNAKAIKLEKSGSVAQNRESSEKNRRRPKKAICKVEEDDYLLEALHNLKSWLCRVGRWLTCYTQYCYPGLRTVEYYRKVEESRAKRKRQKEREGAQSAEKKKKPQKSNKKNETRAQQIVTTARDEKMIEDVSKPDVITTSEISAVIHDDKAEVNLPEPLVAELPKRLVESQNIKDVQSDNVNVETPTPTSEVQLELNENIPPARKNSFRDDDQNHNGRLNRLMRNLSSSFIDGGESHHVMDLLKLVCLMLVPVTMLLSVRYFLMKQKYKRLAGWLRGIRHQNGSLKKETKQLENLIVTTEQALVHFKKSTNKKEVIAQFTSISDNIVCYKREIARMTTEKAELIQELRAAKAKTNAQQSSRPIPINRVIVT